MSGPLDHNNLRARVQRALDRFLDERTPALHAISPDVAPLTDSLRHLLAGGKRLRAGFAYWGALAAGVADTDELVSACASLELLQACALVHDDVMDRSDTRRGRPAAHRQFEQHSREHGWSGDHELFGTGAAILIGDLALSWADEMLLTSGLPTADLNRAKGVFDVMRAELMIGQYLDLLEQNRKGTTVEQARTVIRYKSAKYTVERPLHLGAALGSASEATMTLLSDYGLALGEAFQLRDDVLGVFGDEATTGKPAGDDLRERKQTVLLAEAMADPATALPLGELLDGALDVVAIERARALIMASGALASVEQRISSLFDAAVGALAPLPAPARSGLTELAVLATRRDA